MIILTILFCLAVLWVLWDDDVPQTLGIMLVFPLSWGAMLAGFYYYPEYAIPAVLLLVLVGAITQGSEQE
jgi:hypothetical protein